MTPTLTPCEIREKTFMYSLILILEYIQVLGNSYETIMAQIIGNSGATKKGKIVEKILHNYK